MVNTVADISPTIYEGLQLVFSTGDFHLDGVYLKHQLRGVMEINKTWQLIRIKRILAK